MGTVFLTACFLKTAKESFENEQEVSAQSLTLEAARETADIVKNDFVSADMAKKSISIPQNHISGIYKDTYSDKKIVRDREVINQICADINESEIVQISIDNQEIMTMDGIKDYVQYPVVLETNCEDEYVSVNMLAQDESGYYVQINLAIQSGDLKNADSYNLPPSDDGKRYINCFVRSEELYHDIVRFWGKKITLGDIQDVEKIELFYNDANCLHAGQNTQGVECFSNEDAERFIHELHVNGEAVYDSHSFGITMALSMQNRQDINIYYAEDGCSMFQLDGVSYRLDSDGKAASIVNKYAEKLEKKINGKCLSAK